MSKVAPITAHNGGIVIALPNAGQLALHPEQRGRRGRLPRGIVHIRAARDRKNQRHRARDLMAQAVRVIEPRHLTTLRSKALAVVADPSICDVLGYLTVFAYGMGCVDPRLGAHAIFSELMVSRMAPRGQS